ncbi:MAG TPA: hypothetical protein VFA96_02860 [Nocardioides sp.]|nr:hypothetical protein [Nocardioides sp.]
MIEVFDRPTLEAEGFTGFVKFSDLAASTAPDVPGVYVVIRVGGGDPAFRAASSGGWFKGRDPSVPIDVLTGRWTPDCPVLYIGKATSLRKRLRQYARFGAGKPVGHWGGRYIWQLEESADLLVAWKSTSDDPREVEQCLLATFIERHGCMPFANLTL